MKADYWGFPIVDWNLAKRKKRNLFRDMAPGTAAEANYLGHPSVTGHVLTIKGERLVIGPASVLYSYDDFLTASGLSFAAYMATASMVVHEHMARAQHSAIREAPEWTITYTSKADPFAFKTLNVYALDATGAENYANFALVPAGNTTISIDVTA